MAKGTNKKNSLSGASIGLGVALGVPVGIALDNLAVGIAIGVALGLILSSTTNTLKLNLEQKKLLLFASILGAIILASMSVMFLAR